MEFLIKYKKIFIIFGFILIIIILGYLLYALFLKPSLEPTKPNQEQPTATSTQGGLPVAQQGTSQTATSGKISQGLPEGEASITNPGNATAVGGLTQTTELNKEPTLAATLSSNGNDLQYYNKQDGKFYRINKDGQTTLITDKVFYNVEEITWSPEKNKAILEYPDQSKIIYDFDKKEQISLPKHWEDFDFSNDGSKIVFKSMADSADNRWLAITSEDGTSAKKIAALGDKDDTVYPSWSPNNQTVAMYTEGISYDQQKVYFVGLNNENFKALTIEGRGFQPKWSPQGNTLLYSVYSSNSDLKPEL